MMKKSGRRDDKLVLRQLRQSHHRRPLPAHLPREVKRLEPTKICYPECRDERDYLSEVSAEQLEGLRLFTQTQLLVFLTEGFSLLREQPFQFCNANKVFLTHDRFYNPAMTFLQHCQCVKTGCFWLTPVQLIEEHCQLRAGNGYLAVTHRRPDKLAFLQAFGEQAQTISISPQDFNRVTPSATEDEQVTGEGIIIQHMLYLFTQPVERLTHIGYPGNEPDAGA